MKITKDKILYIAVMALYGTTGVFKHYVALSSAFVSFARALIGSLFLFFFIRATGRKVDRAAVKKNLPWLLAVGFLLGFNWILYFEACRFTTVAKASLCYYMAPVMFMLLSPVLFKEKLTKKKLFCIAVAFAGMVLVSGVLGDKEAGQMKGILLGLSAAMVYTSIVICSKKIDGISAYDKTLVQLVTATLCLFVYCLTAGHFQNLQFDTTSVIFVLIIGILNTGVAYVIYFGSLTKLDTQTVAVFSYADPAMSVILSALLLAEPLGLAGFIGAVLIIGAMVVSELPSKNQN